MSASVDKKTHNRAWLDSRRSALTFGLGALVLCLGILGVMVAFQGTRTSLALGTATIVAGYSFVSGLAAFAALRAARSSIGLERRTWRILGVGLAIWTAGGVAYLAYLSTGGSPLEPAAWSQVGYLAAYPFWYFAFWGIRQPVLASSRAKQLETLCIEVGAVIMFALIISSAIWNPAWPAGQNVSQLVPAILDILLLATFYAAVRRMRWNNATALTWIGYAFATLALTDMVVTYSAGRELLTLGAIAVGGYFIAMTLMIIATQRPLRVAEAQNRVQGTTAVVAVVGLALTGLAAVVAPGQIRIAVLVVGGLLAWRTLAILSERDDSDTDILTGFLGPNAFERHLGGVVQHSSADQPGLLIAIDLNEFGAWNARNGYSVGDELLGRVARALDGHGPDSTVWGRPKADRFVLTTISQSIRDDRALAEYLRSEAALAAEPLQARAAIVRLPEDASGAAEVMAAAEEALRAASEAGRPVVAYSGGEMDGLVPTPGSASLGSRRERIQELIEGTDSIGIVMQPICRLADLRIHGFEALSRFNAQPQLGPDKWIAEATALGLGIDLEVECARRAWIRQSEVPEPAHLSINASPDTIMSDLFAELFADEELDDLILEVTEHERVSNYPRLAARLASLRGRGARIAIDDTGTGHASLNHLIELKPDFIKLDRELVMGLDLDPGKHALVRNMLRLSSDLGAELVAEGIETEGELNALRELGVPLGQGYFLARPAPQITDHVEELGIASDILRVPLPHEIG